jgi:hypothetical protein
VCLIFGKVLNHMARGGCFVVKDVIVYIPGCKVQGKIVFIGICQAIHLHYSLSCGFGTFVFCLVIVSLLLNFLLSVWILLAADIFVSFIMVRFV